MLERVRAGAIEHERCDLRCQPLGRGRKRLLGLANSTQHTTHNTQHTTDNRYSMNVFFFSSHRTHHTAHTYMNVSSSLLLFFSSSSPLLLLFFFSSSPLRFFSKSPNLQVSPVMDHLTPAGRGRRGASKEPLRYAVRGRRPSRLWRTYDMI